MHLFTYNNTIPILNNNKKNQEHIPWLFLTSSVSTFPIDAMDLSYRLDLIKKCIQTPHTHPSRLWYSVPSFNTLFLIYGNQVDSELCWVIHWFINNTVNVHELENKTKIPEDMNMSMKVYFLQSYRTSPFVPRTSTLPMWINPFLGILSIPLVIGLCLGLFHLTSIF